MLNELHERFSIVQEEDIKSGEKGISEMLENTPLKLPDDYISFLKYISGEGSLGIWLEADGYCDLRIYSAEEALSKMQDYELYAYEIWIIGDDLGDGAYFYQKDERGIAIYYSDIGAIGVPGSADDIYPKKIADTLADFLLKGIGIDVVEGKA